MGETNRTKLMYKDIQIILTIVQDLKTVNVEIKLFEMYWVNTNVVP